MIDLTTITLTLKNIRDKLKGVLNRNPNSDLAVSLVKLNAVISELKSLERDVNDKERAAINTIIKISRKDIGFTEQDAINILNNELNSL